MTDLKKDIAERLQIARQNAGLSQGQVAKMIGLHRPTISEIEAGRRRVSAEELVEFSNIYKVSLDWLTCKRSEIDDEIGNKISLAARELSNLKNEDIDSLIRILTAFKKT